MEQRKIEFGEMENITKKFAADNSDFLAGVDFVVGVSRGGLAVAALLASKINKPLAAVYINKNDEIFLDRKGWIENKNILVVDDIIRSGKTLWLVKNFLTKNCRLAGASFFALFKVLPLLKKDYDLPVFARETNNDIILPWDN